MTRLQKFRSLKNDAFYAKSVAKLKAQDIQFIESYCKKFRSASADQWVHQVNRLFLDDKVKPKNHTLIWELLSVCKEEPKPKSGGNKMSKSKKTTKKKSSPKHTKPNTYIKKLGLEPVAERTPSVLRQRIKVLKKNIREGNYSGPLETRAELYLREHIRTLEAMKSEKAS